jgi:hypothetical protein
MNRYHEWLADLRFHLRRGPVIVNKYSLRRVLDAVDTKEACRLLTEKTLPHKVHFVPLPDGKRVVLI